MNDPRDRVAEIERLLASLNEWEQQYGIGYSRDPKIKSSGEANARIAELKRQLAAAGAVYHWNGKTYVLDDVAARGKGRQAPDRGEGD